MKSKFPASGAVLLALSSPAMADHAGPTAIDGNGGAMDVIGPDTLERGKAATGVRVTYLRPEQRPDEVLEELAGHRVHAHNTDYNLNAAIGASYGVSDRLTVSAQLPLVRRDGLREGEHSHHGGAADNEVVELGNISGIGDLSLLAKYRLLDRSAASFALLGGVKLPTGATHERSREGERLETEHQPGTGSWDFYAGAAFGSRLGWLDLDASLLYQFSGKGAQDTRLGDRLQAGIALSHRFGPPEHHDEAATEHGHAEPHGRALSHRFGPPEHHDEAATEHGHAEPHGHSSWDAFVEFTAEWEGRQTVAGEVELESGGAALWLTPGLRFNSAGGFSLGAAVGVPVWQDIRVSHPDNDFRLIFAIGKTL